MTYKRLTKIETIEPDEVILGGTMKLINLTLSNLNHKETTCPCCHVISHGNKPQVCTVCGYEYEEQRKY